MDYPLDTLHTPIVISYDPEAKYSPLGENTTLETLLKWPLRVLMSFPLDTFHIAIVLSEYPDAKYCPFGEKTTLVITIQEWTVRVLTCS